MTVLAAGRNTPEALGQLYRLPVATATLIYAGALVALNATGFATKGAVAATLKQFGRAEATVNNAGADGALSVDVRTGIFVWANSTAGDLITIADIGVDCFILDDQTVAKTNPGGNTRSRAGKVVFVDATGVYVQMGPQF